jgi:hypothetical protein
LSTQGLFTVSRVLTLPKKMGLPSANIGI